MHFTDRESDQRSVLICFCRFRGAGFTAAGSLRLGVSEMTRFGMGKGDFETVAQLIHDVVVNGRSVKEKVKSFRSGFLDLKFCFSGKEFDKVMERLHGLI